MAINLLEKFIKITKMLLSKEKMSDYKIIQIQISTILYTIICENVDNNMIELVELDQSFISDWVSSP